LLAVLHYDHRADHDEHGGVDIGVSHRPQQRDFDQRADNAAREERDEER
jgi:hypothetical protein